jgi:hypothetical protein
MALVLKDRVRESTTTAGTGTLTLDGAVGGFQGFSVIGNGNTTYYAIVDVTTGAWEVGVGTYTSSGQTLSRDTVLESSSGGTLVAFTSNIKDVFCTYPAERAVTLTDVQTLTNKTINLTSNTLVATSAQLASAVTDETGTGALVFATSPTLVTPALGTPSSGVVTNLTGTASININGTVGATTANTGAFTTLAASGAVTLSGGTANGVAYLNGSKVLTTGSALTFDGTNLGVGGVPQYAAAGRHTLNVNGASTSLIGISSGGTTSTASYWYWDGTNASLFSTSQLLFGASNTEQMRLTSTGLGIGTSSPGQRLSVSASASDVASFVSGDTNADIYLKASGTTLGNTRLRATGGDLVFITGLNDRMRLDSSGNLGLGVTPSANDYTGTAQFKWIGHSVTPRTVDNFALTMNAYHSGGGWKYGDTAAASAYIQSSDGHAWYTAASGTAGNAISFTQAMTLDASGNLAVGATGVARAARLTVKSANETVGAGNGQLSLMTTNAQAADVGGALILGGQSNEADWVYATVSGRSENNGYAGYLAFGTSNSVGAHTERARIDSSGNVGIGTTTPNASAILDAQSTTKGVRMPNMTTAQKNAITSPAAGLMVFDTTLAKLCVYSGAAWETITST